MTTSTDGISCPTCNKTKTWDEKNKFRPFCSHRCRLIDLGEWAGETRKIPTTEAPDEFLGLDGIDPNYPEY